MTPHEWRIVFIWGSVGLILGILIGLSGCGNNGPRTELHVGRCGEAFVLPLEMNLHGCAAVQGVYLAPVGLTVTAVTQTPMEHCYGVAKSFPRAGEREGMIRFARFCTTNQTTNETEVFHLIGAVERDGLTMPGYFELAKDDGLATGFTYDCPAEIPTVVFRCTTGA